MFVIRERLYDHPVHKLEKVTSKYGLKISKSKTKIMSFKIRIAMRSKIVINVNTRFIQKLKIQNGWEAKGNHRCEGGNTVVSVILL